MRMISSRFNRPPRVIPPLLLAVTLSVMTTISGDILNQLKVHPGTSANLAGRDTQWKGGGDFDEMAKDDLKQFARERLGQFVEELEDAQRLLYASDCNSLLIIF